MDWRATRLICLGFALLSGAGCSRQDHPKNRVKLRPYRGLETLEIPKPPRQTAPWEPPRTTLPPDFIETARKLFEQGMADPRDCEYRKITIRAEGSWRDTVTSNSVMQVKGWLLPTPPVEKQQNANFAVCWNGLVYPVLQIGDLADLKADMEALLKPTKDQRKQRVIGDETETSAPDTDLPQLVKVCLLLRLGEGYLAKHVWDEWGIAEVHAYEALLGKGGKQRQRESVYHWVAQEWVWHYYNRLVNAHLRGDDALALHDARELTAIAREVEKELDILGVERPYHGAPYGRLQAIHQLPALLQDKEIRAASKEPPIDVKTLLKKGREAPLEHLVEALAEEHDKEEGINFFGSEGVIRKAIRERGEAAVEPLLRALETDRRLTRVDQPNNWKYYPRSRDIESVGEASFSLLQEILDSRFPQIPYLTTASEDSLAGHDRQVLVRGIREYWEQHKNRSPAERWFSVLANDSAKASEWAEVAQNIAGRNRLQAGGDWLVVEKDNPARGEALRTKQAPSVSELLEKRLKILAARKVSYDMLHPLHQIAAVLVQWDGKSALPAITTLCGSLENHLLQENS